MLTLRCRCCGRLGGLCGSLARDWAVAPTQCPCWAALFPSRTVPVLVDPPVLEVADSSSQNVRVLEVTPPHDAVAHCGGRDQDVLPVGVGPGPEKEDSRHSVLGFRLRAGAAVGAGAHSSGVALQRRCARVAPPRPLHPIVLGVLLLRRKSASGSSTRCSEENHTVA